MLSKLMTNRKPILLLTRPRAASEAFAAMVKADVEVIISPMMEIQHVTQLPELADDAVAIFTSRNGVVMQGNNRPAWCVGEQTTLCAQRAGWQSTYAGITADDLVTSLIGAKPSCPLVHLRGTHTRGNVVERLRAADLDVTDHIVYDQVARALSSRALEALDGKTPVIVPLFSPRSAALFASVPPGRARLTCIAMSREVRGKLSEVPFDRLVLAGEPTADAMRESVEICAERIRLG